MINKKELLIEWSKIISYKKVSPYIFRTRLERIVNKTRNHAKKNNDIILLEFSEKISEKMKYISDQSIQNSDGILNTFAILKPNIMSIIFFLENKVNIELSDKLNVNKNTDIDFIKEVNKNEIKEFHF